MKPLYVQQVLRVLLEEYEDIDYLLEHLVAGQLSRSEAKQIRTLLQQLETRNHALITRLQ